MDINVKDVIMSGYQEKKNTLPYAQIVNRPIGTNQLEKRNNFFESDNSL